MMPPNLEVNMPLETKGDTITIISSHGHTAMSQHLELPSQIPPQPRRRSSHASIFSDLSDLDYMSTNSHSHNPTLLRRAHSNTSTLSTNTPSLRQRLRSLYIQNYGALLVLLSQVFGSIMNISARLLESPGPHGSPMHPFQILFVRQFLTAFACTSYALYTRSIPEFPLGPKGVRWLLVSRGVCGFFGVFGMYFSLQYLPLSEATVLTFLAPILTCYICSLVLEGERFTRQQQIAGLVSFVGVVFIAQPGDLFSTSTPTPTSTAVDGIVATNTTIPAHPPNESSTSTGPTPSQHLLAISIAMLGVLGATGAMTSIRAIGTRAHAFISINYFSVLSTVVSGIALLVVPGVDFRLPGNLLEWALLLNLGVCGFLLQGLLTVGLAYGGPAKKMAGSGSGSGAIATLSQHENVSRVMPKHHEQEAEDIEMQSQSHTPASSPHSHTHQQTPKSKPKSQPHPSGNRATSMVYCQMLFALIADKLIFHTTLDIWSWLGSGLILSGAVWVATARDGVAPPKGVKVGEEEGEEEVGLLRDDGRDDVGEDEAEQGTVDRREGESSIGLRSSSLRESV